DLAGASGGDAGRHYEYYDQDNCDPQQGKQQCNRQSLSLMAAQALLRFCTQGADVFDQILDLSVRNLLVIGRHLVLAFFGDLKELVIGHFGDLGRVKIAYSQLLAHGGGAYAIWPVAGRAFALIESLNALSSRKGSDKEHRRQSRYCWFQS